MECKDLEWKWLSVIIINIYVNVKKQTNVKPFEDEIQKHLEALMI